MTDYLPPLCFLPRLVAKPWGGRRLETLLARPLPAGASIGESWELAGFDAYDAAVAEGPLAGHTLCALLKRFGAALVGPRLAGAQHFPLLIKFLDAAEPLSVQVHPLAAGADCLNPGDKHEAWYILHAEPGAQLWIGLRAGVSIDELRSAAGRAAAVDLLQAWPARAGDCYYLPSGTVHALGGGVLVCEVQTPADVTYRLYDWGRRDAAGQPRELHIDSALANVCVEGRPEVCSAAGLGTPGAAGIERGGERGLGAARALAQCPQFSVWELRIAPCSGVEVEGSGDRPRAWVVLGGRGVLTSPSAPPVALAAGRTVLLPARMRARLTCDLELHVLECAVGLQ